MGVGVRVSSVFAGCDTKAFHDSVKEWDCVLQTHFFPTSYHMENTDYIQHVFLANNNIDDEDNK